MSIFPAVRKGPACSTFRGVLAIRSRYVAEFLGRMKLEENVVAQRNLMLGPQTNRINYCKLSVSRIISMFDPKKTAIIFLADLLL